MSPVLPFWILDEVLKTLQSYSVNPTNSILLPLDVCFHRSWAKKLVERIVFNDDLDEFLVEEEDNSLDAQLNRILGPLSEWLTFQVASHRIDEKQGMDVCVRCLVMDEISPYTMKDPSVIIPQERTRQVQRFVERFLPGFVPQVFTTSHPLFWLRLPPVGGQVTRKKIAIHGDIPNIDLFEIIVDVGKTEKIGKTLLPTSIRELLPLVADAHAELAITCFPTDQACQLWVRHLGEHELWVTSRKAITEENAWQQIGRGVWHPLQEHQRLLLGRRARIHPNSYHNLPGSMVIRIAKIGG
jgi:hypothetical protein